MLRSLTEPGQNLNEVLEVSKALGDPVRLALLRMMADGRAACCSRISEIDVPDEGICVCEFVEELGIIQSRASYHLKILKDAGLVHEETRGKWNFYRLNRDTLEQYAAAVIHSFSN